MPASRSVAAAHQTGDDWEAVSRLPVGDDFREGRVLEDGGGTGERDRRADVRVRQDYIECRSEPLRVGVSDDVDGVVHVRSGREDLP